MDRAHRQARVQENVTASNMLGRVTPASGSGDVKNDVRNDEWSIEVKTTTRLSYPMALSTLETAETHALSDARRPALFVAFVRGIGRTAKRYVVTTEDDFIERETELMQLRDQVVRLQNEVQGLTWC